MRGADRDAERVVRDIYDAHYGALAGWAARLVGDRELGHDLATEAFVRLLRDHSSVQDPHAWLYTVTANLVRDHWRKRGRESSAYGRVVVAPGSDPDPATRLTVREVVLALPDRLRLPVILRYYADLPLTAVAARLGKSEGAVKRDLFDARRRMAAQLEGVR
ncbi:MAG: RNA polymerase sigma factor [Intrasporangium sp.]|uniref:RNA polymerase sigma factor n=1 Tax=Intrasporangium sp. TaxID=1925024 RepID=UPI0026480414|nr:RNA polymerase sigma factor [Intrasporangium sp.]MDN5797543.1 RNA polymerase sigma factor [Intrasporangium sp.]